FGGTIDVRYLKSIRSFKDSIKACISCSENECPVIKERLDRHLIQHHSSSSNQRDSQSGSSSYLSGNSSLTSDGQTSSTDAIKDTRKYKKFLRKEILEWAKEIPRYPDQSVEQKKDKLINKFIDKVFDLINDIDSNNYKMLLRKKADSVLNYLPGLDNEKMLKEELKDNLLCRINRLNRKFMKVSYRKQKFPEKPEVREAATSTLIDKLLDSTRIQHISTNTLQEYYNEIIGSDTPYDQIYVHEKKETVNAKVQVQQSINNISNEEENLQNEQEEFKEIKLLFKQKVFDWMKNIMENTNYKFVNTNVDKNFITNILWDQLKQHIVKNSTARSDKLILKVKILEMIDNLPLSTSMIDPVHRDTIAEDLNSRLRSIQNYNQSSNTILNFNVIANNKENIKHTVKNIVQEAKFGDTEGISDDITCILLKNLNDIRIGEIRLVKEELNTLINNVTNLSDLETFDLVNNIIEATKGKEINYSAAPSPINIIDLPPLVGTLSVFKSEHKIRTKHKTPQKEKSVPNELLKLNSSEIIFINEIVEIINTWLDTLPKEFKDTELKYDNIKYLAREIYDQIKLEEEGEATASENEKFKYFIVRKWLNRFDFFEDNNDAKPHIVRLLKELKDIPKTYLEQPKDTVRVCCGSKPQSYEPEILMKNLILKYLEYNYSEDNVATRYLFSHLLKSELPNLCLPSRKEVYDSLEQYVSGGKLSFKKLDKELQYIMMISDLLDEVPLRESFTNKQRIEFINNLAQNIYVIENNNASPNITELQVVIKKLIEELPISIITDYNENINTIVDDIIGNILKTRSSKPCCLFANSNQVNLPIDSKTLSDFIESFIRDNHTSLTENETKLEAISLRLVREINKLIVEKPEAFATSEVYKRLANKTLLGDETVRRFSTELNNAKEISDWLNNLPLLPIESASDADSRAQKIGELVHKMCEYQEAKKTEPQNPTITAHFNEYLEKWLLSFPFDSQREILIPVVIRQLLNRIERVSREKMKQKQTISQSNTTKSMGCKTPGPCCSKSRNEKKQDPAKTLVETIETWCSDLPIQGEEKYVKEFKENIATKLFQTLGDINTDPDFNNNANLYTSVLTKEIDNLLKSIPVNLKLKENKEALMKVLLKKIIENRKIINQKVSGDQYKQKLEDTISMSIPEPKSALNFDPGFEIYKDRLATMFILDNFDYSHNAVKLKYEKQVRDKINIYFENAQKRTTASLTRDQLYNELYSTLFRVPIPNEESITDEVEEIKTRCEIEIWFEKLPLIKPAGLNEILECDKILTVLAKRLHEIEKYENDPDQNMHKEIVKYLRKLPLVPGKDVFVDEFATELQARLKSTFAMRKCVSQVDITKFIDKVQHPHLVPNYEAHTQTPLPRCCQVRPLQSKKPADTIIDMVESWCRDLPIPAHTQEEKDNVKLFKDNMVIKIIIKISELNMNPEIFNDNKLYDALLDDELENIFATMPSCCDYVRNKNILKQKLIEAINSVKPLIAEENTRYKYKQELKTVVNHVLEKPENLDEQRTAVVNEIKNDIVDNFVVYYYYKDDIDGKQMYKYMINEAVSKYIKIGNQGGTSYSADTLLKSNQLLCEMSKVPGPNENALMDEVEEIRMKYEVTEFLNELPLNLNDDSAQIKNQIKSTLARRLSDLEKSGHSNEIEQKMKEEVKKCVKKIDERIDNMQIESFIEKLRNSEQLRKSHPPQISCNNRNINDATFITPPMYHTFQTPLPYHSDPSMSLAKTNPQNMADDQWISLLPITPQNYNQALHINDPPLTFGSSQTDFEDFGQGTSFRPVPLPIQQGMQMQNDINANKYRGYDPYTLQAPNADITPVNPHNNKQSQHYETHDFGAGIKIMSTPLNQDDMRDESVNCQIYGRSQNRSVSQQSYRRQNKHSSQVPIQEQSYESQKMCTSRQNSLQNGQIVPGVSPMNPQTSRYYRSLQQQFEQYSRRHFEDMNKSQQYNNTGLDQSYRNQFYTYPPVIPLTSASSNSQVPSVAIPGYFRPFLPPTRHQKSPCKPCRRSSTAMLDSEPCLRKIVKSQKQAQNRIENKLADDEDYNFTVLFK
ncbi:uncharacterized protein LOC123703965, partial [Colias croceus]|uniref:uncharacterized protein LOC123703965 n=1 Tax=Colias crocea TaxID=72248 RepID=UPI001E27B481